MPRPVDLCQFCLSFFLALNFLDLAVSCHPYIHPRKEPHEGMPSLHEVLLETTVRLPHTLVAMRGICGQQTRLGRPLRDLSE